jgi:hypothetical protein
MSNKINHQRHRFLGIATMTIVTTQLGRFGSAIAQSSQTKPEGIATTLRFSKSTVPICTQLQGASMCQLILIAATF